MTWNPWKLRRMVRRLREKLDQSRVERLGWYTRALKTEEQLRLANEKIQILEQDLFTFPEETS